MVFFPLDAKNSLYDLTFCVHCVHAMRAACVHQLSQKSHMAASMVNSDRTRLTYSSNFSSTWFQTW